MNWVRTAILLMGALLAHGAPRHKTPAAAAPITASTDEIAAARDALRQATTALGEDHPATAFMLSNLALKMQQGGYSNYAEPYALRAIAILERRFGPGDVSLVPPLNVLAEAAFSQARYDKAREFAVRAVAIGPDAGPHYATALHNLAAISQAEGKLPEAVEFYRQALAVRESVLPANHPYIQLTRTACEQLQRSAKAAAR